MTQKRLNHLRNKWTQYEELVILNWIVIWVFNMNCNSCDFSVVLNEIVVDRCKTLDNNVSLFSGDHCERQDYCASSPCRNGAECRSLEDSYKCTCAPGFTGPNCADDIDECERNPCKHGTCKNIHGSYR